MTVREALIALQEWCKQQDSKAIHYGVESLKVGTRALLESARGMDLDEQLIVVEGGEAWSVTKLWS